MTHEFVLAMCAIGAAISVMVGLAAGFSTGNATSKAVESISRQPEASGKILSALIIGNGFAEATAIYGLLVSILLIFFGLRG